MTYLQAISRINVNRGMWLQLCGWFIRVADLMGILKVCINSHRVGHGTYTKMYTCLLSFLSNAIMDGISIVMGKSYYSVFATTNSFLCVHSNAFVNKTLSKQKDNSFPDNAFGNIITSQKCECCTYMLWEIRHIAKMLDDFVTFHSGTPFIDRDYLTRTGISDYIHVQL